MTTISKILLISFLAVFLVSGSAMADNITINDEKGYVGVGQGGEDQETEPGMINSQDWDLEGFLLTGNNLSMVGGFNFAASAPGYNYTSGDIFIDTTGDAEYGDDTDSSVINYGYDYVIHVENWAVGNQYYVYALDPSGSSLTAVYEDLNDPDSNPWRFNPGSETLIESDTYTYTLGLTDSQTGFSGGSHYMVSGFDLGFLAHGTDFTAHFTMQCGNDNLMGSGTTPTPEPASMLLLGTGLIGMAGIGRKKFANS